MTAIEIHQRAKEIFHQSLTLDEGERAAYIERICAGDVTLMREVERMLASDKQADNIWEAAVESNIAERLTAVYEAEESASPIGEVLNNRYLIQSLLGEGGIGIVYRAVDLQINSRPVAVKLLREDRYKSKDRKKDEWLKRKFLQEAEALSRIHHPGVVTVLDKGELSDGRLFFVMEWVEGRALREAINQYGMEFEPVAAFVQQLGQALTAVHNKKILHRDLKPENIMLQSLGDGEERVKLIDFGIAKIKDSEIGPETSSAIIAGTIIYLSPEQLMGQEATIATDVYSLGVIAYEMLTGRWPFTPTSQEAFVAAQEILNLQRSERLLKPQALRSDLPEAAEKAIMKALSFDPKTRHLRAKDFGEELAAALPGASVTNKDDLPEVTEPDVSNRNTRKKLVLNETPSPFARNWKYIFTALIILLLIVGIAGWRYLFGHKPVPENTNSNPDLQKAEPQFALSYSAIVQTYQGGKPIGKPMEMFDEMSGSIYFRDDDRIRFRFGNSESGYLYLLNEGPQRDRDGKPVYHVLFPSTRDNNASALIKSNQHKIVPREEDPAIGFVGSTGAEKVWMIWSRMPVAELEEVKSLNNPTAGGRIKDAGQIDRVQRFLNERSSLKPVIERDVSNRRTNISGAGDLILHLVTLEHR
ncbi:MAG: serine/threonine-protein kinase [Blastocatellia bacterium]